MALPPKVDLRHKTGPVTDQGDLNSGATSAVASAVASSRNSELKVCPTRYPYHDGDTAIFVRALHDGQWVSADIATLDKESLLRWLRSRGGENIWAENVVGALLGYDGLLVENHRRK